MNHRLYVEMALTADLEVSYALDAEGKPVLASFELGHVGITSFNGRHTTDIRPCLSPLTSIALNIVTADMIQEWENRMGSIAVRLEEQLKHGE